MMKQWWENFPTDDQPAQGGIVTRPADPTAPFKVKKERNESEASELDPAKAAADLEAVLLRNKQLQDEIDRGPAAAAAESERKNAAFLRRAYGGNRDYEALNIGPRSLPGQTFYEIAPDVLNSLPSAVGNSAARQSADATQGEFISGILRSDSGATIPPDEMASQKRIYFPVPGDGPEAIAQKRIARRRAVEGLINSAGRSVDPKLRAEIDAWLADFDKQDGGASDPATPGPAGGNPSDPATPGPAGGNPSRQRPPAFVDHSDRTTQYALPPTGQEQMAINPGSEFQRRDDPALSGVTGHVNQMLKDKAKRGEFIDYFKRVGIPPKEVIRSLDQILIWQQRNPGYTGDYDTSDIDNKWFQMPAAQRIAARAADSPVGAAAVRAGNVTTGYHLDNIANALGGNGALVNAASDALADKYPKSTFAGDLAGGIGLYGAGRAAASRLAPSLLNGASRALSVPSMAGDAALGAHISSGSNGTDLIDMGAMARGSATATGMGAVGRGTINTAGRAISPSGGKLAPLYAEGGQPTLGQRMGGAAGRFEEAHTAVPLLGGIPRNARNNAIDQAQRGAFNQALREIDDALPPGTVKGTQAHAYMQKAFNKVYDKARSGMTFRPDGEWSNDFGAILQDVALLPPPSQNTFNQLAMQVGKRSQARGGMLPGDDFKMLSSRIDAKVRAIRKNPSGDHELADALEKLSVAMDNSARRHSPPEAAALLDKADRGYVKSVIIENAAKGAGAAGEFSGKALENAIKQGAGGLRARVFLRGEAPMQDYAAAMTQLGDTVGDSGTAPRLMALGGAGAVGATFSPLLIPSAVSLGTNLPGVRQALNALVAPNRKKLDPARRALERRAHLGGLLGLPMLPSGQ